MMAAAGTTAAPAGGAPPAGAAPRKYHWFYISSFVNSLFDFF